MTTFRSNGKLLLTAEYLVLDGARAISLPTKLGQSLTVEKIDEPHIHWKSFDVKNDIWFEHVYPIDLLSTKLSNHQSIVSKRLKELLICAKQLNENFLDISDGFCVSTNLEFPNNWGLGSSSTLVNNIAQWAKVNPHTLLRNTFGGSGYDIACARNNHPISYCIQPSDGTVSTTSIIFNPCFKEELFFIHLNKKQDSREGIEYYKTRSQNLSSFITDVNSISDHMVHCKNLTEFEALLMKHESLMSKLLNLPTVKSSLFNDYPRAIKSLGAWGGDFVLATGSSTSMNYFHDKGYNTVVPYKEMIL